MDKNTILILSIVAYFIVGVFLVAFCWPLLIGGLISVVLWLFGHKEWAFLVGIAATVGEFLLLRARYVEYQRDKPDPEQVKLDQRIENLKLLAHQKNLPNLVVECGQCMGEDLEIHYSLDSVREIVEEPQLNLEREDDGSYTGTIETKYHNSGHFEESYVVRDLRRAGSKGVLKVSVTESGPGVSAYFPGEWEQRLIRLHQARVPERERELRQQEDEADFKTDYKDRWGLN